MRIVESRAKWMKKASNAYEVLVRIPAQTWPVGISRFIENLVIE
jgi:hypothetical protein